MKQLLTKAKDVRKRAYAPFSKFKVGAALEASDGRVFTGCNVENSSYGLTNCAERTAVFKAIADGATRFKRIAIVVDTPHLTPPCGACRQVLNEFAPNLEIVLANLKGKTAIYKLSELLPKAFRLKK